MTITITAVRASDLPTLFTLLKQCHLPTEGLASHLATTLVARFKREVVGSAALECYGAVALLRSVAVAPHLRGQRLGERLTTATLDLARTLDVHAVYLLTETAQQFFPRFGFREVARAEADPVLHQSIEWTSACPVTAQVMMLTF